MLLVMLKQVLISFARQTMKVKVGIKAYLQTMKVKSRTSPTLSGQRKDCRHLS